MSKLSEKIYSMKYWFMKNAYMFAFVLMSPVVLAGYGWESVKNHFLFGRNMYVKNILDTPAKPYDKGSI